MRRKPSSFIAVAILRRCFKLHADRLIHNAPHVNRIASELGSSGKVSLPRQFHKRRPLRLPIDVPRRRPFRRKALEQTRIRSCQRQPDAVPLSQQNRRGKQRESVSSAESADYNKRGKTNPQITQMTQNGSKRVEKGRKGSKRTLDNLPLI